MPVHPRQALPAHPGATHTLQSAAELRTSSISEEFVHVQGTTLLSDLIPTDILNRMCLGNLHRLLHCRICHSIKVLKLRKLHNPLFCLGGLCLALPHICVTLGTSNPRSKMLAFETSVPSVVTCLGNRLNGPCAGPQPSSEFRGWSALLNNCTRCASPVVWISWMTSTFHHCTCLVSRFYWIT